mgnify:CR=1 FL=1
MKFNIRDFLNKLMWDPREKPEEYTITYVSRGSPGDRASVNCSEIIKVYHRGFEFKSKNGRVTYIPFHRIVEIRRRGEIVFKSPRHQ